jgi:hypothetical protein
MDFEIPSRSKVTVKIYGREVQCSKPTVGQVEKYQQNIKGKDEAEQFGLMRILLKDCKVPDDLINEMELAHFTEFITFLMGSAKKK